MNQYVYIYGVCVQGPLEIGASPQIGWYKSSLNSDHRWSSSPGGDGAKPRVAQTFARWRRDALSLPPAR